MAERSKSRKRRPMKISLRLKQAGRPSSATPRGQFNPRNKGGTRPSMINYRNPGLAGTKSSAPKSGAGKSGGFDPFTFPGNPGSLIISAAKKIKEATSR